VLIAVGTILILSNFLQITFISEMPILGKCFVKTVTNYPCPACGTSRAIDMAIHGNLIGSIMTNPLGIIDLIALTIVLIWIIFDLISKKSSYHYYFYYLENKLKQTPFLYIIVIILFVSNWIWNIAKGL
jgi:hypothetical protein